MAGMTRTRVGILLRKLVELIMEHPEGLAPSEALSLLARRAELSPYELEVSASGRARYVKRLHFATTNLRLAGWLAKQDRSKWVVTEAGKRAFSKFPEPMAFFKESETQRHSLKYGGAS